MEVIKIEELRNGLIKTIIKNNDESLKFKIKNAISEYTLNTFKLSKFRIKDSYYIKSTPHENGKQFIFVKESGIISVVKNKFAESIILDAAVNKINQDYDVVSEFNKMFTLSYPDGFAISEYTTITSAIKKSNKLKYYDLGYDCFNETYSRYSILKEIQYTFCGYNTTRLASLYFDADGNFVILTFGYGFGIEPTINNKNDVSNLNYFFNKVIGEVNEFVVYKVTNTAKTYMINFLDTKGIKIIFDAVNTNQIDFELMERIGETNVFSNGLKDCEISKVPIYMNLETLKDFILSNRGSDFKKLGVLQ